ncbi:DNA damage-inducible protein 1 [Malassezia arunalokei]|uniref:DNA damage-inducible protein 1 n=1 Tax=Malassezia arunalokei TaxID=1514897 RepID=A0AAJ5Z0M9_9BASI|nr:DNA damage-inducible protein 1 [Malassezia arunalokei]
MLTVLDKLGQSVPLDVDTSIELENVKAILEAEFAIAPENQQILFMGRVLPDDKRTLASYGIKDGDLLVIHDTRAMNTQNSEMSNLEEVMRQQILQSPSLQQNLRQHNPVLLDAALRSPQEFAQVITQQRAKVQEMQAAQEELFHSDPFDVEAQKKIEESIRQDRVAENLEHAIEFSPESFGNVSMLYVNLKVNGHPVKAFVDSGAQATIISPDCATRCGIMRLLDTRFAGVALGVGTAKILGRIHSTQIQLGSDLFLPCSFTVLEGRNVDMLFGLDMLKRYQASIDLKKNALIIQDREIPFLPEHEIPKNEDSLPLLGDAQPKETDGAEFQSRVAGKEQSSTGSAQRPNHQGAMTRINSEIWDAKKIEELINLGIPKNETTELLNAANGNIEIAASIYFSK